MALNINQIQLPENLEKIGESAFYNCEKLENVKIPDTVKIIGDSAFCNCKTIEKINIPNGIENIENTAFYGCSLLSSVQYNGKTYTSKSSLKKALTEDGKTIGYNVFTNTGLED